MSQQDRKSRLGVVFSTNSDFQYEDKQIHEEKTLEPSKQKLYISIDRRNRGGKQVTMIKGFIGIEDDLKALAKMLKTKCGVGGSVKDNEIVIQGDFREKILDILKKAGYSCKRAN
ncbi:MAG: translation initiation factor [Bacteroidales bacterium]